MTTTTATCGKCDGKKTLSWTRIANGVCFACGGAGKLVVETSELAAVRMPRALVIARIKSCLDRITASVRDGYSVWADDSLELGYLLGHADADVYARAIAAFRTAEPCNADVNVYNVERAAKREIAILAAKTRTVVRNVRKAA